MIKQPMLAHFQHRRSRKQASPDNFETRQRTPSYTLSSLTVISTPLLLQKFECCPVGCVHRKHLTTHDHGNEDCLPHVRHLLALFSLLYMQLRVRPNKLRFRATEVKIFIPTMEAHCSNLTISHFHATIPSTCSLVRR